MKSEHLETWMDQTFMTVAPHTPAADVLKLIQTDHTTYAPIVDAETNHLLGIVTEQDIYRCDVIHAPIYDVWKAKHNPHHAKLQFFMPPLPLTILVNSTVGQAARMMVQNGISILPIVNKQGDLVGMITQEQIFKMIILYEWGSGRVPTEANMAHQTRPLVRS